MVDIDKKTTDLVELTTPAIGDVIHIVDISDTTDDTAGSSKKIKIEKIIPSGGTTGQVLMKKSDSDFDTEFDDLVAVSVTTKGDLQTHDGSTPTALPVGTDGQILMADDAESNGIKWSDPPTSVSVTTKGDIQTHDATTPDRLPVGVDGQILSADSTEDTGLKWIDAPSGSSNSIINNEVPSGTIDGSNTSFTLASTPVAGSVSLYMNGVLQQVGASNDYTISGLTITFNTAPLTGSILLANYLLTTGVSDNADTVDGFNANATPTANNIPVLDSNAKIPVTALYANGWIPASETWEYVSVDDPTGIFRVNADVTGKYSPGMRIKMTNGGNVIYGIITVVGAYTGGYTSITFLHEIDPTDSLALVLMANSAITANYYSTQKSPFGFPQNSDSWTVKIEDTTLRSQAATGGTIYNIASLSISIPIGLWDVDYEVCLQSLSGSPVAHDCIVSLSTANNTLVPSMSSLLKLDSIAVVRLLLTKKFKLELSTKTTYYLNELSQISGVTLYLLNDGSTLVIKAVCAYL